MLNVSTNGVSPHQMLINFQLVNAFYFQIKADTFTQKVYSLKKGEKLIILIYIHILRSYLFLSLFRW